MVLPSGRTVIHARPARGRRPGSRALPGRACACSISLLAAWTVSSCHSPPAGEPDLGPIDAVVDDFARTVWPGVDGSDGRRQVPLLNGFFEGEPTSFWFGGFTSHGSPNAFWFCRRSDPECPFDTDGVVQWSRVVGGPVFATLPGEVDYSPYWLAWVVRVPEDYQPDELKSVFGIEEAASTGRVQVEQVFFDHGGSFGPGPAIMLCMMVLQGTELEGNGAAMVGTLDLPSLYVPVRRGWHKQYQVAFYDFTAGEGVVVSDPASESVPLTAAADLYSFFRDCDGASASPVCSSPERSAVAPVSERWAGVDLTGDGDRRDTNHVLSAAPRVSLDDPWATTYSALWRIRQVRVPPAADAEVALIDTTGDQTLSAARDLPTIRQLAEVGAVDEPIDLPESYVGLDIPANDGRVFLTCPAQVAAP
jgi:hypothetical protein